jgi:hypothetical protein
MKQGKFMKKIPKCMKIQEIDHFLYLFSENKENCRKEWKIMKNSQKMKKMPKRMTFQKNNKLLDFFRKKWKNVKKFEKWWKKVQWMKKSAKRGGMISFVDFVLWKLRKMSKKMKNNKKEVVDEEKDSNGWKVKNWSISWFFRRKCRKILEQVERNGKGPSNEEKG